MTYQIDSGITAPTQQGRGHPLKYPWDMLKKGESAVIACGQKSKEMHAAVRSAHLYGKRHGMIFTSRRAPGGVRIWRVA